MAATNINRVILTGNLTRDPELRVHAPAASDLRAARRGQHPPQGQPTGEWVEKPNYFDVTIFGRQGENAAQYLSKGRPVAIDGRLEWREWHGQGNRQQPPGGREHGRQHPVPRRTRRNDGGGNGSGRRFTPEPTCPPTRPTSPGTVRRRGRRRADDDIPF